MKVGVVALVGVCVILYQYHLSAGVRFDQLTDQLNAGDPGVSYGAANVPNNELEDDDNNYNKVIEDKVMFFYILILLSLFLKFDIFFLTLL